MAVIRIDDLANGRIEERCQRHEERRIIQQRVCPDQFICQGEQLRPQHRIPQRCCCSPVVRDMMNTIPSSPIGRGHPSTHTTAPRSTRRTISRCSLASISGVAASHVIPGHPRRGSKLSMVRLLDRLSDLGSGPADSPDERLRHGTLIFASVLITLMIFDLGRDLLRLRLPHVGRDPGLIPADHCGRADRVATDAPVRRVSNHATPRIPRAACPAPGLARRLRRIQRDDLVGDLHRSRRSPCRGFSARLCLVC